MSIQPFRGTQDVVIERRHLDGRLDLDGEQPPKMIAKFDEIYRWYFNAHPKMESAGWEDLHKWLQEKGWQLRAKTW